MRVCLTYIVLVANVKLKVEWFSFGNVDLEHHELVHNI